MNTQSSNKFAVVGVFAAIGASICCITPVLALLAGASGVASTFSWLEPLRPWLIGLTALVLGFAWYQMLKKRSGDDSTCACEDDTMQKRTSFLQSKKFLVSITVFAILMTAFPYYSHVFYPSGKKEIVIVESDNIMSEEFSIKGMTCQGCAAHVENEVNKLSGIVDVQASYDSANARVQYDRSKVSSDEIEDAINSTGYKVVAKKFEIKNQ